MLKIWSAPQDHPQNSLAMSQKDRKSGSLVLVVDFFILTSNFQRSFTEFPGVDLWLLDRGHHCRQMLCPWKLPIFQTTVPLSLVMSPFVFLDLPFIFDALAISMISMIFVDYKVIISIVKWPWLIQIQWRRVRINNGHEQTRCYPYKVGPPR